EGGQGVWGVVWPGGRTQSAPSCAKRDVMDSATDQRFGDGRSGTACITDYANETETGVQAN
ncbi:hypothetical protein AB9E28_35975, partial [Rhizobium leguminosarum]|uniref:hypothetical protein n=1 Tax=Rhizobium leguminosarum TaxID=384 RepID=UPI003F9E3A8D